MPTTLAEIPEHDAPAATAAIYADIRSVTDLPLVNLIWRHLATVEGALECTWQAARPLYASGAAGREAEQFVASLQIPQLSRLTPSVLAACGVNDEDLRAIRVMLTIYNRGNALNLFALQTLLLPGQDARSTTNLERHAGSTSQSIPEQATPERAALPSIPTLSALGDAERQLVLDLNQFGTTRDPGNLVASLYRHLAHWPGYLALTWAQLEPAHRAGSLRMIVADTREQVRGLARALLPMRGEWGDGEAAGQARSMVAFFIEVAISRMVPLGIALERSLPDQR